MKPRGGGKGRQAGRREGGRARNKSVSSITMSLDTEKVCWNVELRPSKFHAHTTDVQQPVRQSNVYIYIYYDIITARLLTMSYRHAHGHIVMRIFCDGHWGI